MNINEIIKKGEKGRLDLKKIDTSVGYGYISFDDEGEALEIIRKAMRANNFLKHFGIKKSTPPQVRTPTNPVVPSFIIIGGLDSKRREVLQQSALKRVGRVLSNAFSEELPEETRQKINLALPELRNEIRRLVGGRQHQQIIDNVLEELQRMHTSELEELAESCEILAQRGMKFDAIKKFAERELTVIYNQHVEDFKILAEILNKDMSNLVMKLKPTYEAYISQTLAKLRGEHEN